MKALVTLTLFSVAACGAQQTVIPAKNSAPAIAQTPAVSTSYEQAQQTTLQQQAAVTTTPAATAKVANVEASPFSEMYHCNGNTTTGLHVVYDLSGNLAGDRFLQVAVDANGVPATAGAWIWGADELIPGQIPGSQLRAIGANNNGGDYLSVVFDANAMTLNVGGALISNACVATSGNPKIGMQQQAFSRIVRKIWCLQTWDVWAGTYVDLEYRMAIDEKGNAISMGQVKSRGYGGQSNDAISYASGSVPTGSNALRELVMTGNALPDPRDTNGVWYMGFDPSKNNSFNVVYNDQVNPEFGNPVELNLTEQGCADYNPIR